MNQYKQLSYNGDCMSSKLFSETIRWKYKVSVRTPEDWRTLIDRIKDMSVRTKSC